MKKILKQMMMSVFCITFVMCLSACGQKPAVPGNEPEEKKTYSEEELLEIYSSILNMAEYQYYALLDVNNDEVPELFVTDMVYSEDDTIAYWADLYGIKDGEAVPLYEELIADYDGLTYDSANGWILCNTRIVAEAYPDYYEMFSLNEDMELNSFVYQIETIEDSAGNITEKQYFNGVEVTEEATEEYQEYLAKKENEKKEQIYFSHIQKEYDDSWVEEYYEETNDTNETSSDSSVIERVEHIRKVYYGIQNNLSSYTVEDGGDGTTRYVKDGKIHKIVVSPDTYAAFDFATDYSAEYYYEDDVVVFVFVYCGTEEYRFYIDERNYLNCIRYIGPDGIVHDYPEGKPALEISWLGEYCTFAMQELHWAGVI